MPDDLCQLSAVELAGRIARGEVSSLEAVDAHVARIERFDPLLNATVVRRFDAARDEARAVDARRARGEELGPLGGVPISIKECLDLVGTPSTCGLPSRANDAPESDDPYVARLRGAGAVVLAKTNVPQLLIFIESDNPLYGRTNNPWHLGRTPGGSSGGEGAMIAAGGAPLGFGTDIGGSIRVPSAFNGIFGFKPTSGRLPDHTRLELFHGQRAITSEAGPFARTTADIELALAIANGGRDPDVLPPKHLGEAAAVDVRGLRVGFFERAGWFAPAPAVARAVREAALALEGLGARVVPFDPPHPDRALDLFYGLLAADGGKIARQVLGKDVQDPRIAELFGIVSKSRATLNLIELVLLLSGQRGLRRFVRNYGHTETSHFWKLVEEQRAYQTLFAASLDAAAGGPLDLLLAPPVGLPALVHGKSADVGTAGLYAPLFNLLGYPAGIVPVSRVRAGEEIGRKPSRDRVEQGAYDCEVGSAGLPVGVQIVGRPWREDVVLAAMHALEPVLRERADFPRTPIDV